MTANAPVVVLTSIDNDTNAPAFIDHFYSGEASNLFIPPLNPESSSPREEIWLPSEAYDDDTDMSSDGGVHIPTTISAEQLNMEMDMVDAEVMGPYNVATIAANAEFDTDLDTTEDSVSGFQEDNGFGPPSPLSSIEPDQVSEAQLLIDDVSQQLQLIQEQGNVLLTPSVEQHGTITINGNDFLPPLEASSNSTLEILSQVYGVEHSVSVSSLVALPAELVPSLPEPASPESVSSLAGPVSWTVQFNNVATMTISLTADVGQDLNLPDGESSLSPMDAGAGIVDEMHWAPIVNEANDLQVDDQRNLNLFDFLYSWGGSAVRGNLKKRRRGPNLLAVNSMRQEEPVQTLQTDLRGDSCDFQGIDWTKLEVSKREAREMRNSCYINYTNLKLPSWHILKVRRSSVIDVENYFRFQRMDFTSRINLAHFQLRNLLSCTSRNSLYYAGESKVLNINPFFKQSAVKLDLTDPIVQAPNNTPFTGIQVSTLAAEHNVLIAGGFAGEYAMVNVDAPFGTSHIEGLVTEDPNPITNHIQIHLSRQSGLPQATFSSNDAGLRVLDCTTNTFTCHQKHKFPVNCSAISPDHRLRVLVGDTRDVMICDAETGETLQVLEGHNDYGFACAWADNGWHVATGNQDKLIKIWDARMWTDSHGIGKPLQSIAATVAGARNLKFSPLGSGKRVLVAAESADIVNIIDAETYATKQSLDFYGEICGIDFTPDGQRLFVGVNDPLRGGIMEFEKCGFGQYHATGSVITPRDKNGNTVDKYENAKSQLEIEVDEMATGLDWRPEDDMVVSDPRSKRTATHGRRKAALSYGMAPF